ncbi:hypothetical protein F2P56_001906 [Juglans regia]|uniref:Uncharacterized protein n=2 Tax=Juglans regia TaxID=51240 RepID=A0A833Y7P1_JUGRE|nr:uncharacterized protein LOC108989062 [Juglans regia]KAF5481238.1 hypothetical protein F2P56_001906 [Juglans regia]
MGYEDRWMWMEERIGVFNVQSAYKLLQKNCDHAEGESSNSSILNKLWKAIWKLKLPLKIKIFAWRLCKDCLPTGLNLLKKHVNIDPKCSMRSDQDDDVGHAIVYCAELVESWKDLLPILRNKKIHDDVVFTPKHVVDHAMSVQTCYTSFSQQKNINKKKYGCHWNPPPASFLKLNVDGSLFFDQKKAGIGAVLRDEKGDIIFAASKVEFHIEEPDIIELVVVVRGLQLCLQFGITKVQVESDCKLLIDDLQYESFQSASELANLFVNQLGNSAAHKLARMAWNIDDLVVWGDSVPESIAHIIWVENISCNP